MRGRRENVRQTHLDRIDWRSFGLLGGGVAEAAAGRAHVPEIAADEVALVLIVV